MRDLIIPLFEGFQPLDVTGPHEVFIGANSAMDALAHHGQRYRVHLLTATGDPVTSESGMTILANGALADAPDFETLLVPGGVSARTTARDERVVDWLRNNAAGAKRVSSVCTGTFLLAAAGLCHHKRVTTHWAYAAQLATSFPDTIVDPDPIFVRDDDLWTSAGVTAGIDLSLAMVEEDCGSSVAQLVARSLVVYLRRPGGQSQFGTPVWSESAETQPIRAARDLIHSSPEADLSVGHLASIVGLSERHFTRRFRAEIGESPARYVDRVRVEAARSILETEMVGLDVVARRCGYHTTESLRRAFQRRMGLSPGAYRRQSSTVREGTSS